VTRKFGSAAAGRPRRPRGRWRLQDARARFSELDLRRRADLEDWLRNRVRPMFAGRVLDVTEDVMLAWRILVEDGRRVRHTFSQPDLIIAATALQHGLTVATRDTADYVRARVPVRDPWQD
jgi:predicted nucleic acid-binding protein